MSQYLTGQHKDNLNSTQKSLNWFSEYCRISRTGFHNQHRTALEVARNTTPKTLRLPSAAVFPYALLRSAAPGIEWRLWAWLRGSPLVSSLELAWLCGWLWALPCGPHGRAARRATGTLDQAYTDSPLYCHWGGGGGWWRWRWWWWWWWWWEVVREGLG